MTGLPNPPARVYIRVSRPDEHVILENQRRTAIDHVDRIGAQLVKVYEEVRSGGDGNRSGLNELLSEVRRGDLVVFTSLSRMTRGGVGAALDILRQLEARGVGWHFVEQPLLNFDSSTPALARNILLAVLAEVDADYRRRISVATKAAFVRRKALAQNLGKPLRWGRPKKGTPFHDEGAQASRKGDDFRGQGQDPSGSSRQGLEGLVGREGEAQASQEGRKVRTRSSATGGPTDEGGSD